MVYRKHYAGSKCSSSDGVFFDFLTFSGNCAVTYGRFRERKGEEDRAVVLLYIHRNRGELVGNRPGNRLGSTIQSPCLPHPAIPKVTKDPRYPCEQLIEVGMRFLTVREQNGPRT